MGNNLTDGCEGAKDSALKVFLVEFSVGSSFPDFVVIVAGSLHEAIDTASEELARPWGPGCYVTAAKEINASDKGIIATARQCC